MDLQKTEYNEGRWTIFSLVAVGVFMSTLDGSIVNIALPWIMKDLGTRLTSIEWVVLIYLLTVSSTLLTFGRISDIRGRRLVYCSGFFTFAAGSLLCAISQSVHILIFARSIQGFGAAMLMACSPAIIVDIFPATERGKALGMVGTVVAAGLTTGPGLGGLILNYFSWRVIFYINVPIGIIAAVLALRILEDNVKSEKKEKPVDWLGSFFISACLSSLLLAMTHLYSWGITSFRIIGLTTASALSMAGFIITESRSSSPLLNLSLLKLRLFTLPAIASVIMFASLFTITFLMPFYLLHPMGFSPGRTGLFMVTPFVFLFFISPISGSLYDKIGSRMLCASGMAMMALALLSFTGLEPSFPQLSIIWRLTLAGAGMALFISPNSSAAMSSVPIDQRGVASACVAAARNLGMITGVALAGLIFNTIFFNLSGGVKLSGYTPEFEQPFMTAFHGAMMAGASLSATGVIISLLRGDDKP